VLALKILQKVSVTIYLKYYFK